MCAVRVGGLAHVACSVRDPARRTIVFSSLKMFGLGVYVASTLKRVAVNTKKMSSNPSNEADLMAVEPSTANESAAAPQEMAPEVLLEDADLESPAKKRKVC